MKSGISVGAHLIPAQVIACLAACSDEVHLAVCKLLLSEDIELQERRLYGLYCWLELGF